MVIGAHQLLERKFAEFIGYRPEQVVACSSGSAALHLSLEALRLPPGYEVATGDFNMIAVPRAISLAGLTPVFVDCGDDLLVRPDLLKPAEVIAVHIYGRICDMNRIAEIAEKFKLNVIEDLAEAHGIKPHPDTDAACWSCFKNKIIHSDSEGGIVAFRDPAHAALARQLRNMGFTEAHDFHHIPRGHNYRLADSLAEKILESLERYPENLVRRREIESWYDEVCPAAWRMPPRAAPWVYDLRIHGLARAKQTEIVKALNAAGIQARHSFVPMSRQEEFKNCRLIADAHHFFRDLGKADAVSREVFYLPLDPKTTRESTRQAFAIIEKTISH